MLKKIKGKWKRGSKKLRILKNSLKIILGCWFQIWHRFLQDWLYFFCSLLPLLFVIAMMPLNYILRKCTGELQRTKKIRNREKRKEKRERNKFKETTGVNQLIIEPFNKIIIFFLFTFQFNIYLSARILISFPISD